MSSKDPAALFYVDEANLSTSDDDECQNLMDCNVPPEEVVNPVFRAKYEAYLKTHKEDSNAE